MRNLFFAISLLLFASLAVCADSITVTLNTNSLIKNTNGPYTLDFQFVDGDGTGDGNNTVILSNFLVTGGSVSAPSSTTGSVTTTTSPFSITMVDSSFFDEAQLPYLAGATLTFEATYTTNSDSTAPDSLTFAILDKNGNEIPTSNPNGNDSFLEVDLPSSGSSTTITASGSSGTSNGTILAPVVVPVGLPVTGAPEPSTLLLVVGVIPGLLLLRRRVKN